MDTIKINSFTVEITTADTDNFENQEDPDIEIMYTGENGLKFNFAPEYCLMDFDKCAQACRNGTKFSTNLPESNGGSDINVNGIDGIVSFGIYKYGSGYGGTLTVSLPSKDCAEMFEQVHEHIELWMAKREATLTE